ncbi:MAG: hypothetical protein HUJ56_11115 [Erysipelotrichaceae bacterium]|nr:hypothetical protein [Erysipelotrichaceae bacterium]
MERFIVFNDLEYYEDMSYEEVKEVLSIIPKDELSSIIVAKQLSLKYFGFNDVKKKEVIVNYDTDTMTIDGAEEKLDLNKVADNTSYTIVKTIGHPTPEGECLDEYLV